MYRSLVDLFEVVCDLCVHQLSIFNRFLRTFRHFIDPLHHRVAGSDVQDFVPEAVELLHVSSL